MTLKELFSKLPLLSKQNKVQSEQEINEERHLSFSISIDDSPTFDDKREEAFRLEEIKRREENSYPSKNGLKPHEILMLFYCNGRAIGASPHQQFWHYGYAVDDTGALIDSLERRGFLRISSASEALECLKVAQLKEILKSFDLSISGNKATLINRVRESIAEERLEHIDVPRIYKYTALGQEEVDNGEYVMYAHSHKSGLIPDVWTLNVLMQNYPPKQWRDCVWGELNRQAQKSFEKIAQHGNYDMYCTVRYEQYRFLAEEQRYDLALSSWVDSRYNTILHSAVWEYKWYVKQGEKRDFYSIVSVLPLNERAEKDLLYLRSQIGIDGFEEKIKECVSSMGDDETSLNIAEMICAKLSRDEENIKKRCDYMEYLIDNNFL